MALSTARIAERIKAACRNVAVAVIAGVFRRRSIDEVDAEIKTRPHQQQIAIIGTVLGLLFAFSLVAAQFGWIGMLVFWLAVIVLVN